MAINKLTLPNIQKTVADYYSISVAELVSPRKSRSLTRARHMAMFLARTLTTSSLPEIGDAFGGRDHSTVSYACGRLKALMARNICINMDYETLKETLCS